MWGRGAGVVGAAGTRACCPLRAVASTSSPADVAWRLPGRRSRGLRLVEWTCLGGSASARELIDSPRAPQNGPGAAQGRHPRRQSSRSLTCDARGCAPSALIVLEGSHRCRTSVSRPLDPLRAPHAIAADRGACAHARCAENAAWGSGVGSARALRRLAPASRSEPPRVPRPGRVPPVRGS